MAPATTEYLPTGNEILSIPTLRAADAAIESFNLVLMKWDGLLEIVGPDADTPFIECPAMTAEAGSYSWTFGEHWIPEWTHKKNPKRRGAIVCPPGEHFAMLDGEKSASAAPDAPTFRVNFGKLFQTANIRYEIPEFVCAVRLFQWCGETCAMIEIFVGEMVASLAFRCPGECAYYVQGHPSAGAAALKRIEILHGARHLVRGPFTIDIVAKGRPTLLFGVGLSSVASVTATVEVARNGIETYRARTESWLRERRLPIESRPALEEKANRNAHFARFFAMATALDTHEVVSMTSRSHRYYVCGAYWDRDSLLWLYPMLIRNDPHHAAELLRYAFGRQLAHAGVHSRHLSGQLLEFGFELDEWAAPLLALATWANLRPTSLLPDESVFRRGVEHLLAQLPRWRHPQVSLYATELMPTDDPIVGGRRYLTYNNALVAHTLESLAPWFQKHLPPARAAALALTAHEIRAAITRHLVRDGIFQWATDLEGGYEAYDEAAGSLLLLPYYKFCNLHDPIYRRTVEFLYSSDYGYLRQGPFSELGNRHTESPHPWVLSACNSVLSGARVTQGLDFLERAPMDHGIACESVDVNTGFPASGEHFATCAGFVAHAIVQGTRPHASAH